jgi:arylsulfatase A-like enzyme
LKKKGVVDEKHLINNGLDLLPTVCEFAGVKAPEDINGKSAVPLTKAGSEVNWRDHIFLETEIGFLIHTGRYKYELDDNGKNREMFVDLKSDPGEKINKIKAPQYKNSSDSLRMILLDHLKKMNIKMKPLTRVN